MISLGKLSKNSKEIILEQRQNGCIECISHTKDDCGYTRIKYNGKHERLFRIIYMKHHGEIPKGMLIRHKCDNPSCCNIEHLEIGTVKDNVRDMINRGRDKYHEKKPSMRGTKNKANKLSEEQVKEIYTSSLGCRRTAKKFGVSSSSVVLIRNKETWKWLTDEIDKTQNT